jgi:diguanylate cyclase (GGDEF)-like protein
VNKIKELEEKLAGLSGDSRYARERVGLLNQLAHVYVNIDPKKAGELVRESKDLAKAQGYQEGLAGSLWVEAMLHFWHGEYKAGQAVAGESLRLSEKASDQAGQANAHNVMGSCLLKLGEHAQALIHHLKALRIFHQLDDSRGLGLAYNNLGADYSAIADYGKALEYYELSLEIRKRQDDLQGQAAALMNIGTIYEQMGEHQTALEHHQRARDLFQSAGDARLSICLNNIGSVYEKLEENQKALDHFQKGLAAARERGYRQVESALLSNIGVVMHRLGHAVKAEECFRESLALAREMGEKADEAENLILLGELMASNRTFRECADILEKGLEIARHIQSKELESRALQQLAEIHKQWDKPREALEYYERYAALSRKLKLDSLQKAVYNIKVQQQVSYHARETEELRRRSRELEELNAKLREADQEKEFLVRSLEAQNRKLEGRVTEDAQSGLYNLGAFREKLKTEMVRSRRYRQPLSLAMAGIDRYGETAGHMSPAKQEQLVGILSRIFKENMRLVDLAGHFNHRKFILAFPETGLKKALAVCERLQRGIQRHDWRQVQPGLEITVSFGLCELTEDLEASDFLKTAEAKLAQAEAKGPGRLEH